MELKFYEIFLLHHEKEGKNMFQKTNLIKKIEKLSLKRTEKYEKVVVRGLHRKRKKIGEV